MAEDSHGFRALIVHPAAWAGLVRYVESCGLTVFPMPSSAEQDFPHYGIGVGGELAQHLLGGREAFQELTAMKKLFERHDGWHDTLGNCHCPGNREGTDERP